jgi:hypothetical protein
MGDKPESVTGGGLCGAVRYEASEPPIDSAYCHCKMCQRWKGAPVSAGVGFRTAALRAIDTWSIEPANLAIKIWHASRTSDTKPPAIRLLLGLSDSVDDVGNREKQEPSHLPGG